MIAAVLALAAALAGPVPPGLAGRELDRLPTTRKEVVLTIDAGGNSVGGWSMLTTLKRKNVAATFFLTGRFVVANPAISRVIGHSYPVANHTWSHAHLPRLSNAAVEWEIVRAERAIRAGTGRDPRPVFRFPYGDRDARSIAIANRLGYVSIRWTVDTLGWMPGQTTAGAVRRVVDRLKPGAIVLMHIGAARDGSTVDARALPAVIDAIRRRGYTFTTFDRLRPRPAGR